MKVSRYLLAAAAMSCIFAMSSFAGWEQDTKGWYYTEGENRIIDQFRQIDHNIYHFDSEGYINTGWQLMGDTWYYFYKLYAGNSKEEKRC